MADTNECDECHDDAAEGSWLQLEDGATFVCKRCLDGKTTDDERARLPPERAPG